MKRLVTFIMLFALLAGILAACAQPTPETVEVIVTKEVPVEVIVTKEVIVTQEVEVQAPAPECPLSGPGSQPYVGKELRVLGFGGVPQFVYQNTLLTPQYEAISGVKVIWDDTPYPELFPKIEAMCG